MAICTKGKLILFNSICLITTTTKETFYRDISLLNASALLWYHSRCEWEGFKHTKQKQSGHFMPQARFWWHLTARKAISFTIQSQTLLIAQEVCCSLENTLWYSLSLIFAVHLSLCLFLCGENWFTRVVILIWHSNIPLNAHHLETFVVLMAIHYGFQDKFMLSLNLTKHRNKHFPNAPYLFSRVDGNDDICLQNPLSDSPQPVMQDCIDWIISPINILGTFLPANYSRSLLWAGSHRESGISFMLCHSLQLNITVRVKLKKKQNTAAKTPTLQVILTSSQTLKTLF